MYDLDKLVAEGRPFVAYQHPGGYGMYYTGAKDWVDTNRLRHHVRAWSTARINALRKNLHKMHCAVDLWIFDGKEITHEEL